MKTQKILQLLNRKAIFSGFYLIIAATFAFAWLYFWQLYPYDYACNATFATSALSSFDSMLYPNVGPLIVATVIIYLVHFVYGAFYYPSKYRPYIIMDMESAEQKPKKDLGDASSLRGSGVCVSWALIFCLASYDVLPVSTIVFVVVGWILLHIALIILTSTTFFFGLSEQTVDLSILIPEKYPETKKGKHIQKDLYFFIPTSEDESTWRETYLSKYAKDKKNEWAEELANNQRVKDLSEKLAKS